MKNKTRLLLLFLGIGFSNICFAQVDSSVFSLSEYLENIRLFHPIAKKADLQLKVAAAEILSARGNFDPTLSADWNEKNFDKKLYYRQYQAKLKIPTILGLDVVGGYENTEGNFLNPENKTDEFGLWHVGLELNVLQGLIFNERRVALQQAKVFQQLSENERQSRINDLLYDATGSYLMWQQFYYFEDVLKENIDIAETYYKNTKTSFLNGEKTGMDTLEAFIMFQDALNIFQKNKLGLIDAIQKVENYLWYNDFPIELQEGIIPENYNTATNTVGLDLNVDNIVSNNPLVLAYNNKKSYYEIEQKLKRQKVLPKLKLKYNQLLATETNSVLPSYALTNYKWGFEFSMPLLFRSERAGIQLGQIKINEVELDIQNKSNELQNKIQSSVLQLTVLKDQLILIEQKVAGYKLLLEGETEKFNFGESSVFLLTKRQEKYINERLKLIEFSVKLKKEYLTYLYYTNQLI